MNTFIYLKAQSLPTVLNKKVNRREYKFCLASLLIILMLFATNNVLANLQQNANLNTSKYAFDILVNTQEALNNVDMKPADALASVNQSLKLIEKIQSNFHENTLMEFQNSNSQNGLVTYTHLLPRLDVGMLSNSEELSTLKQKLDSNILYSGGDDAVGSKADAWFDYTFAKASLVSVREALNVNHTAEAVRNLKRVYEAIYISPDFKVSEQDLK